ncbi:hypothetical protein BDN72DRAFT_966491 [Pluteus cervinus]|uniref:Uncharacterized protein n=1 Tax=Pluteus cervinus TaxID=181527 RepID=A0ACD2ZWN6_9AGAR|nr:hypothetical protein BDN72DRAFT_966491 [Pluteus cervinus]
MGPLGFPRSLSPTILLRVILYLNVLSVPKLLLFLAPLLLLRYIYEVLQLIVLSFVWEPEGTLPIGRGDEWVTASIIVLGSLDFTIIQLAIAVVRRMVLDRTNSDGGGDVSVGIDESGKNASERDFKMKPVRSFTES